MLHAHRWHAACCGEACGTLHVEVWQDACCSVAYCMAACCGRHDSVFGRRHVMMRHAHRCSLTCMQTVACMRRAFAVVQHVCCGAPRMLLWLARMQTCGQHACLHACPCHQNAHATLHAWHTCSSMKARTSQGDIHLSDVHQGANPRLPGARSFWRQTPPLVERLIDTDDAAAEAHPSSAGVQPVQNQGDVGFPVRFMAAARQWLCGQQV